MMFKSVLSKIGILLMAVVLIVPTTAGAAATSKGAGADLRATLGQILGEHALLAIIAMQKGIDGKADFDQAAAALNANTDDLSAAVASVYGNAAGDAFKTIWSSHIGYFVDYVKATAANDSAAKQKAKDELNEYKVTQAKFFADANPNLQQAALEAGLTEHINMLLTAFDAYVAKDYTKAYDTADQAYKHMFMFGDILSAAIEKQFPNKFTSDMSTTQASDLRSALGIILGEHATLAVWAMQKGIDGAPDFNQAAGLLNKNTDELSAAVASVYGNAAGDAFKTIWSSHIGYFVDYVKATAAKDEAAKKKAKDELNEYKVTQAKFFADANPNLQQSALEAGLTEHINMLLMAFDDYVAKDYTKVYSQERMAYAYMFMFGDILSEAIVMQYPDKFGGTSSGGSTTPSTGGTMPSTGGMDGMNHGGTTGGMNGTTSADASPELQTKVIQFTVGSKMYMVNGQSMMMTTKPIMYNNRTYIPLRYLAANIGAKISFNNTMKSTTLNTGSDVLEFWNNSRRYKINNMLMMTDSMVISRDGRTLVPVRFVAETFEWNVTYNSNGMVTLSKTY
ncbi:copper amine oxidase N-terminal domain-containing protein [Paenibacillus hunanensis]|uniref:copper amine oxidase N-terminal domain-containing protein n=1 Tax=Paenibacillus hunanensis TaxID=539262 RepID=UPI002A6B4B75|nr:copper amine oxidase N-terminal domain-containing protein [Paenibacillus hunanensis]WPP41082.1 copper amine oxidase N-terminal domain-containing protein [Paenibacillus hunanensis]